MASSSDSIRSTAYAFASYALETSRVATRYFTLRSTPAMSTHESPKSTSMVVVARTLTGQTGVTNDEPPGSFLSELLHPPPPKRSSPCTGGLHGPTPRTRWGSSCSRARRRKPSARLAACFQRIRFAMSDQRTARQGQGNFAAGCVGREAPAVAYLRHRAEAQQTDNATGRGTGTRPRRRSCSTPGGRAYAHDSAWPADRRSAGWPISSEHPGRSPDRDSRLHPLRPPPQLRNVASQTTRCQLATENCTL